MEKYGVMKVLQCIGCECIIHVPSNITDPELEKLSFITEGHVHVWKELQEEDERTQNKSADIQS